MRRRTTTTTSTTTTTITKTRARWLRTITRTRTKSKRRKKKKNYKYYKEVDFKKHMEGGWGEKEEEEGKKELTRIWPWRGTRSRHMSLQVSWGTLRSRTRGERNSDRREDWENVGWRKRLLSNLCHCHLSSHVSVNLPLLTFCFSSNASNITFVNLSLYS